MTVFEAELKRIADVLAVRAETSDDERREVHVLAAPGRPPQEIAGDVVSLAALRGIDLPGEAVHVVQLQAPSPSEEAIGPAPPSTVPTGVQQAPDDEQDDEDAGRVVVDGVVVVTGDRMARAITTVRLGERAATGTAVFVPAMAAARRGVAEATVGAVLEILDAHDDMAVDAAVTVHVPPHEIAIVTVAVVGSLGEAVLVGAARVQRSGENEAVARAVLDATNRWFDRHD